MLFFNTSCVLVRRWRLCGDLEVLFHEHVSPLANKMRSNSFFIPQMHCYVHSYKYYQSLFMLMYIDIVADT